MAGELHNGKRRGRPAKADQAARWRSLVSDISDRRQQLDQCFFDHIRNLRGLHGDRAVDQALAIWQQQRDAVAIAPRKAQELERRGPQRFR